MKANEVIRMRRKELKMTLKEVANAVGVSEATVSRWESGDIKNMRRDKIAALARVLVEPAQNILTIILIAVRANFRAKPIKKRAEPEPRPYEKSVHAVTFSS